MEKEKVKSKENWKKKKLSGDRNPKAIRTICKMFK